MADELEDFLKTKLKTKTLRSLGSSAGGCINEAQSYDTDEGNIFVKTNTRSEARQMFDGEYCSLEAILQTETVRVPKPIQVFDHPKGQGAVFVMEHLNMQGLRKHQAKLGEKVARLHLHNIEKIERGTSTNNRRASGDSEAAVEKFGFHSTTCCGYIPQDNTWQDDWLVFFTRQRLQNQLDRIDKKYHDPEVRSLWSRLQPRLPEYFKGLEVKPSLLHGDLWGGNVAETDTGPVIFDPASFYGHHEYDLSIAGMFGGFSSAFYSAYHELIPKAPGFQKRHELYTLFHYLNHWNHFGTSYRSSSISVMQGLL